jgi:hypothetical protein
MSDWPEHDYWLWDENGKPIWKHQITLQDHPDAEFLAGTDYEPEWSRKFFWSADEATALSFGRSPSQVAYDKYMEEMDQLSEFATNFCDLREVIMEAQRDGLLPTPLIPAQMYVEWATKNCLPFPPSLAVEVRARFDKVMAVPDHSGSPADVDDAASAENTDRNLRSKPVRAGGSSKREDRTSLAIIYALAWRHYGLGKRTKSDVANRIEEILDDLRGQGADLAGKFKAIGGRLEEAIREFGEPPEKSRN